MAGRELTPREPVVYADGAEESAFAQMLGGLIEANVERDPAVRHDLQRLHARVGVHATDLGELVTLDFADGRLTVRDGLRENRDVTLHASSETLMALTAVDIAPLRIPNLFGEAGRGLLAQAMRGQLRIEGVAGNLTTLNRLTRLFSVR